MKTLIIDKLPHLFLCQGDKDLDFKSIPCLPVNKNYVIMKWIAWHYPSHPWGGGGGGDPEISNDWYVTE